MSKADGKRILVFGGWFGSRNAGDEAILLGCKKVLERAIPGARIFAHSTDPAYTRDVCGVEPVFAPQDTHFLNKLRGRGVSVEIAMQLGAWNDIGTVMRYYREASREELQAGVAVLSSLKQAAKHREKDAEEA